MKTIKLLTTSTLLLAALAGSNTAQAAWTDADVGTPTYPGSIVVDGTTNTISGGGDDIWNNSDNFFYHYQAVQGPMWTAVMRVADLQGPDTWTKCNLMVRVPDPAVGTPQGGDPHVSLITTRAAGQNVIRLNYRSARGGGSGDNTPTAGVGTTTYPNNWMKVVRSGSKFTMYRGANGTTWTEVGFIDTATTANGFNGTAWTNNVLVGVAVTAHNNGSDILGVAQVTDLSITVDPVTLPTTIYASKQVVDANVFVGTEASFSFDTTNNGPVGMFYPQYQWYKNNQLVTNANSKTFTFLAHAFESGTQVYCKASFPPADGGISLNSATGTVTAAAGSLMYTNGLKVERFYGATRVDVEAGNVAPVTPTRTTSMDFVGGFGDNYSQRVSGWFKAPTTTNYTFFVASDDDSDVFLSTDMSAANKRLITQQPGWSGYQSYTGDLQKSSDTWQPNPAVPVVPAPYETGIPLVAGNLYYLETVMHQGGGGDNLSVTYRFTADTTDVVDFVATKLNATNGNLVLITTPTTNLVWTTPPTNTTVYEGSTVTFRSLASSTTELGLLYQWYRANAPIAGATAVNYSFPTIASDNGAQFYVVAKTALGELSITSAPVTLTVLQSVFEKGVVKVELWVGATRAGVEAGTAGDPSYTTTSPAFEAGINNESGDGYTRRLSGFFVPATTANYDFWVNGDDSVDLFVSTSASPANKVLVAQETAWSGARQWGVTGGGSNLQLKRSDTFTNATSGDLPLFPNGINKAANTRYYVEVVQQEGSGGDSVGATMKVNGAADPVPNDASTLTGDLVGMNAIRCGYVAFTQQPLPASAESGFPATFSALGITDSTLPVGVIGDPRPYVTAPVYVMYRWLKNGSVIPGAIASTLTIPSVLASDNNADIVCQIRALGYADNALTPIWSNSTIAKLTVNPVPATLKYAGYVVNTNLGPGVAYVTLTFDKAMDLNTLSNAANYTVAGGLTKTGVITVNTINNKQVNVWVTGTPTYPLNITVSNLKDSSGLAVTTGSPASVNPIPFTVTDIGTPGVDPVFPSSFYVAGAKDYTIVGQGSDFWNAADGGNLSWELKTGDFDVVTRVKSVSFTSPWAKAGLMARETLDAGSRYWNIINDPAPGANFVEATSRTATDTAAAGFDGTRPAPTFPNAWVRLKRAGNVITAYYGTDGTTWTLTGTQDASVAGSATALPSTMYVGLCLTAHNNDPLGSDPTLGQYWCQGEFADYNSSYIYVPAVKLTATQVGNNLNVSWTPATGTLQSSPVIGAGAVWTPAPAGNPAVIPIVSGQNQFFRVLLP